MIDIERVRKEFIKYAKKFDLKEKNIMRKFHHSFRVMEYCIDIAKSLNLSKEDIDLAATVGLLHDIGRFEQWKKYQTYDDKDSIDHGDLGVEILKKDNFINNFIEDDDLKQIILIATKNHNKYETEKNISEKSLLISKIIKDADKLDIIKEQKNQLYGQIDKINKEILNCFDEKKLCPNSLINTIPEEIFRMMSFIYDLNFKYSFEFILKNKIIENKIHLLKCYSDEDELLDDIENKILTYIKERSE